MELLAIWQGGFYLVCFCFGWELRELVGEFIGEWGLLGCGVAVIEQVPCGSRHDMGRGAWSCWR
jgi:hypothetical protein